MSEFTGVITAMVTPFSKDGSLDLATARKLAGHLVDNGSSGVVVSGTTGESPTLEDNEKLALLDAVLEEIGDRAQVICGTGSNDTAHSVELSRAAASTGAHGILVVAPYYNRPNRAGLLAHFDAVAESVDRPVIVYNIPSRTGVNIAPELLEEIGRFENVVAVKQANDAEIQPVPGLDLLAGNDDSFLQCLEAGGVGGILVASHLVGERMKRIFEFATGGDADSARRQDAELHELYGALSVTTNPIPIKAALDLVGLCNDTMRLPMVEASGDERAAVEAALLGLGLLEAVE